MTKRFLFIAGVMAAMFAGMALALEIIPVDGETVTVEDREGNVVVVTDAVSLTIQDPVYRPEIKLDMGFETTQLYPRLEILTVPATGGERLVFDDGLADSAMTTEAKYADAIWIEYADDVPYIQLE